MSFITSGLDTSKVYNRAQPPGGKCSDLFGNNEKEVEVGKSATSNKDNAHPVEHKEQVVEQRIVADKKEPQAAHKAVADVKPQEGGPAPSAAPSSNSTTTSATTDYAKNRANSGRSTAMW
eukprot:TRINITY_DN5289_c0_g1_i1.p1 TRINITY_DN5289_c0_g1~~TRINITY_DN5289_c0_g1_i1.p1  ORF type:complete len:120 (-),score=33.07 TRINITY_DN5289_c0_g1_i1:217-576(-)